MDAIGLDIQMKTRMWQINDRVTSKNVKTAIKGGDENDESIPIGQFKTAK